MVSRLCMHEMSDGIFAIAFFTMHDRTPAVWCVRWETPSLVENGPKMTIKMNKQKQKERKKRNKNNKMKTKKKRERQRGNDEMMNKNRIRRNFIYYIVCMNITPKSEPIPIDDDTPNRKKQKHSNNNSNEL